MLKIIANGRLTKDSETRTNGEQKYLSFTLAVNGKKEGDDPTFLACSLKVSSDKLGTYLKKGTHILIDGDGYTKSFTTKDGETKQVFQIMVNDITFLDSQKKENNVN